MTPPIDTRFDLVTTLTDMAGAQLRRQRLWQVPGEGQIVNIGGYPYRVIDVGWALPDLLDDEEALVTDGVAQYAYVKVQKASAFKVVIGGRTY